MDTVRFIGVIVILLSFVGACDAGSSMSKGLPYIILWMVGLALLMYRKD